MYYNFLPDRFDAVTSEFEVGLLGSLSWIMSFLDFYFSLPDFLVSILFPGCG
jgi:hypothetical protein